MISRTSSLRFKSSPVPLSEIARELHVDAIIQGSVIVSTHKLGIRVQLVDPFANRHLWGASYEAQLDEIVGLQRQIAGAIAKELRGRLKPTAELRLTAVPRRIQPEVYEACMMGRLFWNRRTEMDLEKGIERFEQAIALDPTYAEAYVGIADSLIMLGIFGLRPPRDTFPNARTAAEKALHLDPDNAAAQTSLGTILDTYYWDAHSAEQRFKRALELNPNSATAHQWYGSALSTVGRNHEAIALVEKARTLDPLSLVMNAFLGLTYLRLGSSPGPSTRRGWPLSSIRITRSRTTFCLARCAPPASLSMLLWRPKPPAGFRETVCRSPRMPVMPTRELAVG